MPTCARARPTVVGEGDVIKIVVDGAAQLEWKRRTHLNHAPFLPSLYAHLDVSLGWIMDAERKQSIFYVVLRALVNRTVEFRGSWSYLGT